MADFLDGDEKEDVPQVQKLLKSIDLNQLRDPEGVVFELSKGYDEIVEEDEDTFLTSYQEILERDSGELQIIRGGQNSSFAAIGSTMTNIDEEGLVKKQIIRHGVGDVVPSDARVVFDYSFYKEYAEAPFDSTALRDKKERIRLSNGETLQGLELALKSMKKKEQATFLIDWRVAYGELGCPPRIEPKCSFLADITMCDFSELNTKADGTVVGDDPDFNDHLKEAKNLNCSGGEKFKKNNVRGAIECYKKELRLLTNMRLANEQEETKMLRMKVRCHINMAACYNKSGRPESACIQCKDALSIEPNNIKAMFHFGKAHVTLSNFSEARRWLKRAHKMEPNNKDINAQLAQLEKKLETNKLAETDFCKKSFGSSQAKNSEEKK